MKELIIIGNWKMNKNFSETEKFISDFSKEYQSKKDLIYKNVKFGVGVPSVNLSAFRLNKVTDLKLAAQNVSDKPKGAYTGEVSTSMLNDLNVDYVILGHSERRTYYHETNEEVYAKAKATIEAGMTPIICVGETLEEYEKGLTKEVVKNQIEKSVADLDYTKVVVAYEPIWAIGTGKVATPEIAQDVCAYIHSITSNDLKVQYGGSVNPNNINELSSQKDIDGFLVGGASLEVESFVKLLTLGK
ncbi:triose-phosphate isomerase [Mycoplasma sp. CSL10137]|uniref:triose-phosphate isomerase n=1 Tax=Mycoplasma sp. CSL10137 TaxID=2813824 RepID=UPI00197B7F38|nr:triose-phosphate isomerase [Mycoplasma sp. CSL10137]MBN4083553.1 triose-phosphate isomerase [Mycoplasma sp. CSL10137]